MVSPDNERDADSELDAALDMVRHGEWPLAKEAICRIRNLFARLRAERDIHKAHIFVKDWIHVDEVRVMLRKARTIAMYRLEPDEATDAILREHGHGGPDDGMAND